MSSVSLASFCRGLSHPVRGALGLVVAVLLSGGAAAWAGTPYQDAVVADSPSGYWRLGELSGPYADSAVGSAHPGAKATCCGSNGSLFGRTSAGLPLWNNGAVLGSAAPSGPGLSPNGAYVEVAQGSPQLLPSGVGAFSLEAWVKPRSSSGAFLTGVIGSYGMDEQER
jgi:hypothetical protein